MKKNLITALIIILFLSFFAFLNWNYFNAPFERDEGEYAYSAWLLRTGGTPYQDSFMQKPPMIIYTYAIGQMGQTFSPLKVWPPRALSAIFTLITAALIYLIAKKEWGLWPGIFSAFLFLPMIAFPVLTPFSANTEKFMILPMVGLLALYVFFSPSPKTVFGGNSEDGLRGNSWVYILAGVLSTLAILYKPICLPVILFINIFWLFKIYQANPENKFSTILKPALWIAGAAILSAIILLLPFLKVWPKFFEEVVTFNVSYASAFENPWGNFMNYVGKFFHYWWILIFLLVGFYFKKPSNILYYFALIIFSLITIFSTPIGHYYLGLMPFLALFCGALFSSCLEVCQSENQKLWATCTTLLVLFLFMLMPIQEQFSLSPNDLSVWVYGTVNPFVESAEVAKHLASVTTPSDLVFVAGSEPQIYYYAERKSDTRFVITYPLNLPTPYQEKYQKELVDDLEKTPPVAIVLSQRSMSGLWNEGSPEIFIKYFIDLISNKYKIVGGYVWGESGSGKWQDTLTEADVKNASFLLLIKK